MKRSENYYTVRKLPALVRAIHFINEGRIKIKLLQRRSVRLRAIYENAETFMQVSMGFEKNE